MLVPARTTFALRCTRCGKLETAVLSRFDVVAGGSAKLLCSCGSSMGTVGRKRGQISLQLPCYLCDGMHFNYYSPREFWSGKLKQLVCAESGLQLGAFGEDQAIASYARPGENDLDRLLEDSAFDDYFEDREVMYQAVTLVNTLADCGKVACVCGSTNISVDVYPDRLELTCEDCGSPKSIPASSSDDASQFLQMTHIEVGDDRPRRRKATRNRQDRE